MSYEKFRFWGGTHRTICSVLEEMRQCLKTLSIAPLAGLIEEAQSMANRMENGLSQKSDLEEWETLWREKKAELKKLQKEFNDTKAKLDSLKEKNENI